MFARSAKILCLLALLPALAQAKSLNFADGIPLGLGLEAGVEQNPDTDLVSQPQDTSAGFSHYFGFTPFLDFGNFVVRFSTQLHFHPIVSGKGTDSTGAFGENSDTGTFVYGGQILLAPYVSDDQTKRAFIKLGLSQAILTGKNTRTYDASGLTYAEKFEGRTREMLAGAGFEFFLVQNYSLQLDAGFRQQEFENLELVSGTDLSGAAKNKGDPLTNGGAKKKFNSAGAYFSVGLNLHF